jgi:hypothetical protein
MQSLRVTLYEIFGYLAPGLIGMTALAISIWAVYLPALPITSEVFKLRPVFFFVLAFASYLIGHFLQALGNLHARAERRNKLCRDCESLQRIALEALTTKYKIPSPCESLSDVTALAFAIMSQMGRTDAYEVFVYREGFYRAGYLSFILLAVSFLFRCVFPGYIDFHGRSFAIPKSMLVLFFLLSSITALFFFLRFRRFGEYRVKHVLGVISVAPISNSNSDTKED